MIGPLRRNGTLLQSPYHRQLAPCRAILTTRKEWHDKPGALTDSVIMPSASASARLVGRQRARLRRETVATAYLNSRRSRPHGPSGR